MDIKVGIISLGCAKNTVDTEIMLGLTSQAGYQITNDPATADIIVINTCGFIASAQEEAINTILEMSEYKNNGVCKGLIVAGCLSQRFYKEIIKELPEVDAILGVCNYDKIIDAINIIISPKKNEELPIVMVDMSDDVTYLNLPRVNTCGKGSAYLKISEGCDNKCAYCAIPGIRGPFRSRPQEDVIAEAKKLAAEGIKEIIVVAQDTTRYGIDLYGEYRLSNLLYQLNEIEELEWIRLMYLYPDEIAPELIDAIKNCSKVLHYVDLPIQHISNGILSKMNRRGDKELIQNVFRKFQKEIPDCILRTTVMVGFPGETEEDFNELEEFVGEMNFHRLGVFAYSNEAGTVAAKMKDQVPKKIKTSRCDRIMSLQKEISHRICQSRVGKTYKVLVEDISDDGIFYIGRSYAEAPEVDGKIYFTASDQIQIGDMVDVEILIAEDYDLTGCMIEK